MRAKLPWRLPPRGWRRLGSVSGKLQAVYDARLGAEGLLVHRTLQKATDDVRQDLFNLRIGLAWQRAHVMDTFRPWLSQNNKETHDG